MKINDIKTNRDLETAKSKRKELQLALANYVCTDDFDVDTEEVLDYISVIRNIKRLEEFLIN